jgi:hypothetical protein
MVCLPTIAHNHPDNGVAIKVDAVGGNLIILLKIKK